MSQNPPAVPQSSEIPSPISVTELAPRFENLGLEDGLSQTNVYDILQDRSGFMWFTTQAGLNRWDGYEMKVYTHEPFDDNTLSVSWVWGLSEAADGTLLIGTNGGGLDRFDPITEKFTHYRPDPDDSTTVSAGFVGQAIEDRDGIIWAATPIGLDRMNPDRPGVFQHYRHSDADTSSLSNSQIRAVFEDSQGRIWVSTWDGLNRMDAEKSGRFERFLVGGDKQGIGWDRDEKQEVFHMLERPEEPGILWVGTENGIVRLDAKTGSINRYIPHPDEPEYNRVFSPSQDPMNPGVLWVPTYAAGLCRFDVRSRRFVCYQADAQNPHSLTSNAVFSAYVDRSGMVWVGSDLGGVDRFNPASVGFGHYRSVPGDPNSLPGPNVWAVTQTPDGHVWVATEGLEGWALTDLDRENDKARHFRHDPNDPYSVGAYPGQLLVDKAGVLWVGSSSGVAWYDPHSNRFYNYRNDPNDPTSVARGRVNGLAEDHIGNLWVGTQYGLSRMGPERNGKFQNYTIPYTLPNSDAVFVFSIEEDPAGFMWLGTRTGVVRLDPLGGETKFYGHDPNDPESLSDPWAEVVLVRDREPGAVWVATSEGGLNRLDVATGKFRHWLKKDGLADNVLYSMVEDSEGRLWMGTQHGLSRFDPETESFRNYGLEIGLQSLEFTQDAAHVGLFGEMFFGGVNGLNTFFPNALSENTRPPEVALVDLKLFNQSVKKTGAVKLDKPLNEMGELKLDYKQRDITFDFVALHYADSENNEFAYKMDGYNKDWVYIGKKRSASFTNLPPGEYTFHVKAANSDGVWNEEGTSIRLEIAPPFWATWWFRIAAVLLFGGIVYGGVRMRIRQIAERNRLLESEVTKRTAELKESNDQLEQSHTIVEAINQETSFRRLLTKILEEARIIPGVEKATALVYMHDEDAFRVRASSGWDVQAMQNIKLTKREAKARYVDQAEEVGEDIFVAKNVAQRTGAEQLAEYGNVASFLVLRVRVDDDIAGYLVFDNLTNEDAFEQRDVALLERLKEHIQSAFIKTRILEDLQNTLTSLRSTQDRLVQSEKMASLGQLTAGIAHEIKNPLNFVNNFSEVTTEIASDITEELDKHRDEIPAAFREELEGLLENLRMNTRKVAEHGKRADAIVQNMLEHSKAGEGERHATDLNDLLDEYVTLAHHGLEARGGGFKVAINRNYDDKVGKVDVVPQELGRVFMNLIGNAFDALKEYGANGREPTVTVSTQAVDGQVEIRVADNGPGIPPKVKAKIFEPFFTTKPTGSGTGLGLSMSYDIVTKGHGGTLEVESDEGQGATFVVRLPS